MSRSRDPVCGALVKRAPDTPRAAYAGRTHYFCCELCLRIFQANPGAHATERSDGHAHRSQALRQR